MAENNDDFGNNVDLLTAKIVKEVDEDFLFNAGNGNEMEHLMTTAPNDDSLKLVGSPDSPNNVKHTSSFSNSDTANKNGTFTASQVPLSAQVDIADELEISESTRNLQVVSKEGDSLGALSKRIVRAPPSSVEDAHSLQ